MTGVSEGEPRNTVTITLPAFLQRWIRLIPKSTPRAALFFFTFGVGFGLAVVVSNAAVSLYRNRPLPQKAWQERKFDAVGLRAKLETDWANSGSDLRYKLLIRPSDPTAIDEFSQTLIDRQFGGMITVNLYDARHFLVAKSDNYLSAFTRVFDDSGKIKVAVAQDKFFITRDQYASLSSWDFSTNLPLIQKADGAGKPSGSAAQTAGVGTIKSGPREGDEIISGYDAVNGNLETNSGRTFFIYKPGEQSTAISWRVSSRFHYKCDENFVCVLTKSGTDAVLHARLRK